MTAKGMIDPNKLPPTESAAHEHILRVYFQCLVWKSLKQFPSDPLQMGWKLEEGVYSPVLSKSECAPTDILNFIRCKCKAGCSSNLCSCKKHGLNCVLACTNCRGDCENGEVSVCMCDICL